jgi:hypothetical protein
MPPALPLYKFSNQAEVVGYSVDDQNIPVVVNVEPAWLYIPSWYACFSSFCVGKYQSVSADSPCVDARDSVPHAFIELPQSGSVPDVP